METKQIKRGAVKIGRSGTKLHPAIIDPEHGLFIQCRCPGTSQGGAYYGAKFFENVKHTCGK
jgi:hypothetical protein